MTAATSRLACVTGRFQPVHRDHLALFGLALASHHRLVVAVTNPDPAARRAENVARHRHTDQANPFSYYERVLLLAAALDAAGWGERAVVVPFDLTRPEHWTHYVPAEAVQHVRTLGPWEAEKADRLAATYPVVRVPADTATGLAATEVRATLRAGGWPTAVPDGAAEVLAELLRARPMSAR